MISNQFFTIEIAKSLLSLRNSLNLDYGKAKGIFLESISVDNLEDWEKSEYTASCVGTLVEDNNPILYSKKLCTLHIDLFAKLRLD